MIRHLTRRQTSPPADTDLKRLLAQELLGRLSREAGAPDPDGHPTNARLLVGSIVDRSIENGDFRGLRYLTDLIGIGEKADIRREQLRLEKEKAAAKLAEQNRARDSRDESSRALEVYLAVQTALKVHARDRTLDEILQTESPQAPV